MLTIIQDYNLSAIKNLSSLHISPLKKVKRKVGYGQELEEMAEDSTQRLKRLAIGSMEIDSVNAFVP